MTVTPAAARRPRLRALAIAAALWPAAVAATYYVPGLARCAGVRVGACQPWLDSFDGDRSLPFFGEALRASLAAAGGAALLLASAVLLGAAICRLAGWRFAGRAEAVAYQAALGIGAFAYLGLALATRGFYRPGVLRVAVALPLLFAAVRAVRGRRARDRARPLGRRIAWPSSGADRLWAAAVGGFALVALAGALAPEIQYDAVWFHLHFPRLFLEAGRLVDLPAEYVSLYPMTWELWFGYGLAVGGSGAAVLLHWACLPLAAAATFALARLVAPRASPWLAAALFASVPTVLWEATTAYLDLALALHVALVLHALVAYVRTGRRQWLALAAANLGLALATKHLALVVLALACAGLAIALWWRDRRVGRALAPAVALGLAALVLPLPWYLRAWTATGNPVFPELYRLFGGPTARWDAQTDAGLRRFFARFGYPRTAAGQLALPWRLTMHASRFGGTAGPLLLALVPLVALRRLRGATLALVAFVAAYAAIWASPLASFQLRWLVPALPALAVLAALGAGRLAALLRVAFGGAARTAWLALLALLVALNAPPFTWLHMRDHRGEWTGWLTHTLYGLPLAVVTGGEPRDAYLARNIPTYRAWQWANDSLPPDARVLVYGGGDHLYSARDRLTVFAPTARDAAFAPAGEEDAAFRRLRALGVTHLLVDERFLETNGMADQRWDEFALTRPSTRAAAYDVVYRDGRCTIYRVKH